MAVKKLLQAPGIRIATDMAGNVLQAYFRSSQDEHSLRKKEMLLQKVMPFLFEKQPVQDDDLVVRTKYVLANTLPGKALDVGYYDGAMIEMLRQEGVDAYGIDHMHRFAMNGTSKYCIQAYAGHLPFQDNTFSTVILSHSLEHILNADLALREANRVLARNGRAIVVVPKHADNKPGHLRFFDEHGLKSTMMPYFKIASYSRDVGAGHACIGEKLNR